MTQAAGQSEEGSAKLSQNPMSPTKAAAIAFLMSRGWGEQS